MQAMTFVKGFNKMSVEDALPKILEERYSFGYDDGKTSGIKIGRAEGRTEGKTEGILEIARNMLKIGVSEDIVEKSTNLPKTKIRSIQKEIQLES